MTRIGSEPNQKKPRNYEVLREEKMKRTFSKSIFSVALALLMLAGGTQTIASPQAASVNARQNRIVGLWDVQVTLHNCSTGAEIISYRSLHKYELGGTAQLVPATNPALLSAHPGIWSHVQDNDYQLAFKMFRFDAAGHNIGWAIVRNNITINEDATEYSGSGQSEIFDSNGNMLATSCPTFTGTRFQ